MNIATPPPQNQQADTRPAHVSEAEWQARIDLAACYRLVDHFGMTDLIYNHITARVPGADEARVWVVRDRRGRRGRCMSVSVIVQAEAGEWVTVQGDLSPGDLLVVAGATLSPGQPVRIRKERGAS